MPDQSEFEHAFIASAPDFRGTFRCAIAPPMRSLCSCKTALGWEAPPTMRWAANQCEYGPISVKVLVYTETSKPCSFAAKGRAREFVGRLSINNTFFPVCHS